MPNPRVTVTYDDTGVSLIVVAGGALSAPVALTPAALVALLAASGGAALEQALAEAARRPHSLPDALGQLQSVHALLRRIDDARVAPGAIVELGEKP
jgi:hypothetical protein